MTTTQPRLTWTRWTSGQLRIITQHSAVTPDRRAFGGDGTAYLITRVAPEKIWVVYARPAHRVADLLIGDAGHHWASSAFQTLRDAKAACERHAAGGYL